MSQLLNVFDQYSDFDHKLFYTHTYNTLPSEIEFKVQMEPSKTNIESVLQLIKPVENGFELLVKNWSMEDSSNSDFAKDFPFQLFYKSKSEKCTLSVAMEYGSLSVKYLYSCANHDLELWVSKAIHELRQTFGLSRTPTFNVLVKNHNYFETEEVRTEAINIDISKNYNSDFEPVHDKIEQAFSNNKSGLILLHGNPGTGKTTYIKSLISNHQDLNFIFVQNEFVSNLLDPDFISFLLKQRNSILVIEDAEKVITARDQIKEESVVSTILQLTDGLFSDYLNIKIICTFNSNLSQIDTALLRKGRMIAMYEFKPLDLQKTNQLLATIGAESSDTELTVADIFNHKEQSHNNVERSKIGF